MANTTITVILPSGLREKRTPNTLEPAIYIKELYEMGCSWEIHYNSIPIEVLEKWQAADILWKVFQALKSGHSVHIGDTDIFRVDDPTQIKMVRDVCHDVIDRIINFGYEHKIYENNGDILIDVNYNEPDF